MGSQKVCTFNINKHVSITFFQLDPSYMSKWKNKICILNFSILTRSQSGPIPQDILVTSTEGSNLAKPRLHCLRAAPHLFSVDDRLLPVLLNASTAQQIYGLTQKHDRNTAHSNQHKCCLHFFLLTKPTF